MCIVIFKLFLINSLQGLVAECEIKCWFDGHPLNSRIKISTDKKSKYSKLDCSMVVSSWRELGTMSDSKSLMLFILFLLCG
jgi:hypothetical protein